MLLNIAFLYSHFEHFLCHSDVIWQEPVWTVCRQSASDFDRFIGNLERA